MERAQGRKILLRAELSAAAPQDRTRSVDRPHSKCGSTALEARTSVEARRQEYDVLPAVRLVQPVRQHRRHLVGERAGIYAALRTLAAAACSRAKARSMGSPVRCSRPSV